MSFAPPHTLLVETRFRGHIALDTNDGLDIVSCHRTIERIRTKHITVVSHADRRHILPFNFVHQEINLGHSIKHGILSVVVQVDEGRIGHGRDHRGHL